MGDTFVATDGVSIVSNVSQIHEIEATVHHGRMGEGVAEVIFAEVGVGVEMDDGELVAALREGPDRAEGDEMFAAEHDGKLAGVEDLRGALFDEVEGGAGGAEGKLHVAGIEDRRAVEVLVLIGGEGLDAEGLVADGGRAETGAGTIGGGGVVGRAENDGLRVREGGGATDEMLDVGFHGRKVYHIPGGKDYFRAGRRTAPTFFITASSLSRRFWRSTARAPGSTLSAALNPAE